MIQPARADESDFPTPSADGDSILEDLIEECTNRLQAEEAIVIEELAARHPEHAERLRRLLPSLEMMAEVGRTSIRPMGAAVPAKIGLGPPPSGVFELGDYRVVRVIGRGGMGIVYEALQLSLNRRVALKVLPFAAALDPLPLRRFRTEAQAAAQLHHTSIVPVFSVGCEHGIHFYAMQFIEGRTIAALIQERRDAARAIDVANPPAADREYLRSVVRLGIQAAEALDHAHRQGIIHRDIKPANMLVDVHGNLWITDFGLARFVNEPGLTLTGDLIGTLRYMSPEQALARRLVLDHRTDIYSLGATLYELLTLRPVVDGRDRQEVLRRIAQDEPVPPRRLDPAIPRDLETILRKSLAREPGGRYATAQELADDLRRFLEYRPIKARRPRLVQRATKWLRRHPVLVGSAMMGLILAVIALSAATALIAREQAQTRAALEESRAQHLRARRNFRTALHGVGWILAPVMDEKVSRVPGIAELRDKMSDRAEQFYRGLRSDSRGDLWSRHETIDATLHIAGHSVTAQGLSRAVRIYREAIDLSDRLIAEYPNEADCHNQNGQTHNILALLLWARMGRRDEAAAEFARAAVSYRRARELEPHDLDSLNYSAWFFTSCPIPRLRDPGLAARLAREGIAQDPHYGGLGQWMNLGIALYRLSDWDGAIAALEQSMAGRSGGDSFEWFFLAMAHARLSHEGEARRWFEKAVRWMEANQRNDPELHIFRSEAAALLDVPHAPARHTVLSPGDGDPAPRS